MSEIHQVDDLPWLALLENASDGIAVVAAEPWRLIGTNQTFADWLGEVPEALRGRPLGEVFRSDALPALVEQLEDVWNETVPSASSSLERFPAALGRPTTVHMRRVPMGERTAVAMLLRVGGAGDRQEAANMAGRRDPLTGLPDRTELLSRMAALMGGVRAADQQFAVLFIDLDNFKQVNDAHGHLVGDRVLGEVGGRLADCVRAGDTIARFGGDEFVALVEHVNGWQDIEPVVERIQTALARPIALEDGDVMLSVSVGVAEASAEHNTPEDLLRAADRAMYASKRAGI